MSNKRLNETIQKALKHNSSGGGQCLWLDAYNNAVFDEFSPTIRTTIQTSCMNFIMEIEETNKEPKICAMRGRCNGEWHESEHEQRIECREDGVTNTITGVSKDNMVAEPTIIQQVGDRGNGYYSEKDTAFTIPANPMSDRTQMVKEPKQDDPVVLGWSRGNDWKNMTRHPVSVANCVTAGKRDNTQNSGNIVDPKRGQKEMGVLEFRDNHVNVKTATKNGTQQMEYGGVCDIAYPNSETRRGRIQEGGKVSPALTCESSDALCIPEMPFRVRRLTERELFRLMDLSEDDIDKIQNAGISKTQQAKMAGNSIVVSCLYHIFRKMFVETEQEERQITLF